MENILPFNPIGGDNEFMKCIETTSQSPEAAAFRHHNVEIFITFDINEDDTDIMEYENVEYDIITRDANSVSWAEIWKFSKSQRDISLPSPSQK